MDWEVSVRELLRAATSSSDASDESTADGGGGPFSALATTLANGEALPCPPTAEQEQFYSTVSSDQFRSVSFFFGTDWKSRPISLKPRRYFGLDELSSRPHRKLQK